MILDHERKKENQPTSVTTGNGDSDTVFARAQNESTVYKYQNIKDKKTDKHTHKHFLFHSLLGLPLTSKQHCMNIISVLLVSILLEKLKH